MKIIGIGVKYQSCYLVRPLRQYYCINVTHLMTKTFNSPVFKNIFCELYRRFCIYE